jgi:hypothetical protein
MSALGHLRTLQCNRRVRFTPESGHVRCNYKCPLCAISGHQLHLFDHLVGALLTSHIAPGRRTLAPSTCGASAARTDAMAAETTSIGWLRNQLLTAPILVD